MIRRALWLAGLLCMANAAAQGLPQPVDPQPTQAKVDDVAQRQVLLMLKVAPAHYTPGGRYGDDYANAPGRVSRRRTREIQAGLVLLPHVALPVAVHRELNHVDPARRDRQGRRDMRDAPGPGAGAAV